MITLVCIITIIWLLSLIYYSTALNIHALINHNLYIYILFTQYTNTYSLYIHIYTIYTYISRIVKYRYPLSSPLRPLGARSCSPRPRRP